jgi:hypothetical protein
MDVKIRDEVGLGHEASGPIDPATERENRMITSTTSNHPAVRTLAVAAAIGFLGIAVFELVLALGAPLGRAAWGGSYRQLPAGLRIASAIAVAVWVFASMVVLGRAGIRLVPLSDAFVRRGTWVLVGVSVVAAIVNFASPSAWERLTWGPASVVLAALCFVVARSGVERGRSA